MAELVGIVDATETALPEIYADYEKLEIVRYKNGQEHVYGVKEVDGDLEARARKTHLPSILTAYGMNTKADKKALALAKEDPVAWTANGRENYLKQRNLWIEPDTPELLVHESARRLASANSVVRGLGAIAYGKAQAGIDRLRSTELKQKTRETAYGILGGVASLGSLSLAASGMVAAPREGESRGVRERIKSFRSKLTHHADDAPVEPREQESITDHERISAPEADTQQLRSDYETKIDQLEQEHKRELEELEQKNDERAAQVAEINRGTLEEKDGTIRRQEAAIEDLQRQLDQGGLSVTDRIGQRLRYRNEQARSRRLAMTVEEREKDRKRDKKAGVGAMVGAVAAASLIALGGAYIWGEHEEQEGRQDAQPHLTSPPQPNTSQQSAENHTVNFRGHSGFKVSLPSNLVWRQNTNGSYRIETSDGQKIVPHVYWDQQGNLDPDTKQLLLTNDAGLDLRLTQKSYKYHTPGTSFDHHYMTVVRNS